MEPLRLSNSESTTLRPYVDPSLELSSGVVKTSRTPLLVCTSFVHTYFLQVVT